MQFRCAVSRASTSRRSCGYADPIRRRGKASLRRWGCRSDRRAKPGRVDWRLSCGQAGWVQLDRRADYPWFASVAARPPDRVIPPDASAARSGNDQFCGRGGAARRGPRRAIGAAAFAMDPPDVLEQHPIGGGTPAFDPRAPGIVAADRQTQHRAHHSDWPDVTMLIDEPKLHREAAPKMSA